MSACLCQNESMNENHLFSNLTKWIECGPAPYKLHTAHSSNKNSGKPRKNNKIAQQSNCWCLSIWLNKINEGMKTRQRQTYAINSLMCWWCNHGLYKICAIVTTKQTALHSAMNESNDTKGANDRFRKQTEPITKRVFRNSTPPSYLQQMNEYNRTEGDKKMSLEMCVIVRACALCTTTYQSISVYLQNL